MVAKVFLSLGSNEGDRIKNLQQAIDLLIEGGAKLINSSSVYTTASWGNDQLSDFYNMVIHIQIQLEPLKLLQKIEEIERKMGRSKARVFRKTEREYQDRLIDIDILYYNDLVLDSETLQIPHPRMHLRNFVLVPLLEIAPDLVHPVIREDSHSLIKNCADVNKVEIQS